MDDAYDRLKTEIIDSKLAPGFHGAEPEIASRLGMSRTPVREALIRLEGDGLIELVPRRGVRVLGISCRDLVDIYDLLAVLEGQAASSLARRSLSAIDLEKLEGPIRELEKAAQDNNLERWSKAEDQFYRMLLGLEGNWRLQKITCGLQQQVYRARMVLARLRGTPVVTAQDYRDLLAAIVNEDTARAYQIASQCRKTTQEAFRQMFSTSRLSQI